MKSFKAIKDGNKNKSFNAFKAVNEFNLKNAKFTYGRLDDETYVSQKMQHPRNIHQLQVNLMDPSFGKLGI